jgi:hypothetical protein
MTRMGVESGGDYRRRDLDLSYLVSREFMWHNRGVRGILLLLYYLN